MSNIARDAPQSNEHSFAPITPYDQAGYVWVSTLYCIIFSSLVLLTRFWIKRFNWGKDDTAFGAAFVAQVGHVASILVALKNGLGKFPEPAVDPDTNDYSLPGDKFNARVAGDETDYEAGGKAAMAAMIFLLLALALTKISLLLFMHRLMTSQSRYAIRLSYSLIGLSSLWGLASIISIGINCSLAIFLTDQSAEDCKKIDRKWAGIATVDALSEFIIIAVPVVVVWPLNMSNSLKIQACSAFFFRLGVAALAIVHVVYVAKYEEAAHPSIAMVPALIIAQAELCWSLVSATIPNLKNFMKSFATGFGHVGLGAAIWPSRAPTTHREPKGRRVGSTIPLGRISRKIWHTDKPSDFGTNPQSTGYSTEIYTRDDIESETRRSGGSQELIIRKDVTMTVDRSQKFGGKL